jgi:hypothetical protein
LKFIKNNLQNEKNDMNNPPMRRNKFEIQVHRGVKGVRDRGFAESREKRKKEER